MSMFPSAANPIVYAQFNLQGRWKRMLTVAGGYGFLMGTAIWLTTLPTNFRPRDMEGWIFGITVLQVLNLLVFGSFRVEAAVRGDVTSRMLESHRLMPTPPLGSILGYLFGAPLQAFLLAITNFILGSICCVVAGLSLNHWAMLNCVLMAFALFVYAIIAQFSFLARGGFILILIMAAVGAGFSNPDNQLMPSSVVLLFPVISDSSVFAQMFRGTRAISIDPTFGYLVAIIAQAVFTAVAIRVAVRRYLSANLVGLTGTLGLIVLLTWVCLAVAYAGYPETFASHGYFRTNSSEVIARYMFAFVSSCVLAMFPIAGAARAARLRHRIGGLTAEKSNWLASEWGTAILAAGIVCLLMLDLPLHLESKNHAVVMTIVVIFNFMVSMACLFSWGYLLRRRAWILAAIWLVLTWLVPVIIDAIYRGMTDTPGDATAISSISPGGALAMIFADSREQIVPGIGIQVMLSAIPLGLLLISHARRRGGVKGPAVVEV